MPFQPSSTIKTTTTAAVWLATALLHVNSRSKEFRQLEIFQKVKELGLTKASDATIRTHISSYCVANRTAQPGTDRKLVAIRNGWFRLYRPGDPYNASRKNGRIAPLSSEIPEKYRHLLNWYNDEYVKKKTDSHGVLQSKVPFAKIGDSGLVRFPDEILSHLQLSYGDYVGFVKGASGAISLKKAEVDVRIAEGE